jgi:Domain of unknown function (DUF3883)
VQRTLGDDDLRKRLVLVRTGWCMFYNGTPGDEPTRGGAYNVDRVGSEAENFRVLGDHVYGYAATSFSPLRVAGDRNDSLSDVTVAVFATRPGAAGQVLVGWYRHATFAEDFERRPGAAGGIYLWRCRAADAVLLPPSEREVPVPKGRGATGQAQVAYARDEQGRARKDDWIAAVRNFISQYRGPSVRRVRGAAAAEALTADEAERLLRGQAILASGQLRDVIERHAMRRARQRLRVEYDEVQDVSAFSSFDFLCRRGRLERKIEVKGTQTNGQSLLFSNAEVQLAKDEHVDLYVISNIVYREDEDGVAHVSRGDLEIVPNWGARGFRATAVGWQVARSQAAAVRRSRR